MSRLERIYSKNDYREPSSRNLTTENENGKQDLREDIILYFYSSMLPYIIQRKEPLLNPLIAVSESTTSIVQTAYAENDVDTITDTYSTSPSPKVLKAATSSHYSIGKSKRLLKNSRRDTIKQRQKSKKSFKLSIPPTIKKTPWFVDRTTENVKIEFLNENRYEGAMYSNMLHGQGKYTWSNGTIYEGEFKNNEITGVGRFQFPDRSVYSGEVYKNYFHGTGLLFPSTNPSIYKGQFHFNTKQGIGWQLFSNNNTYEGEWVDGQMNGEGCRRYPSGALYVGKFVMGQRHGHGVAVMKNNDIYVGDWLKGRREGFGDYVWNARPENYFAVPVVSCYYGSWVDDKRDGIGVVNFGMQGGSRYAGYFSKNEKHGAGVIICENGHVIESSPLFINDKPIHISCTGDIEQSSARSSSTYSSEVQSFMSYSNMVYLDNQQKYERYEKLREKFSQELKYPLITPTSEERSMVTLYKFMNVQASMQNKYDSGIYNILFPKIKDHYSSLNIPIGISSELIDLNAYIYKIIEYKSYKNENNNYLDNDTYTTSTETYSDYELHKFEEKMVRKAIVRYLGQLRRIYYVYAKLGCLEKDVPFKLWLMRIFFWQLYRDCKIPQKGISLIDIDLMFSEKSTFDIYVVHNPFEIIYFWQFLESLLYVAVALYGDTFISSNNGVLKQSFESLMEKDILPNAGHFQGSALFEYRDVIPIKAAYNWYRSFGEPHTTKELYRNLCKLTCRRRKKCNTKEELNLPFIQIGHNSVNFGNKIFYFEDDELIPTKPIKPKVKSIQHDNPKKLYFLDKLKPKKIIQIINSVCPCVKIQNDIINLDYKLSFLEFHEIVMLCTQEKVKNHIKNPRMRVSIAAPMRPTQEIKKRKRMVSVIRKLKKAQG